MFHDDERLTPLGAPDIVHANDVRARETRDDLRFLRERRCRFYATRGFVHQQLDRNALAEAEVRGRVDRPHSPAPGAGPIRNFPARMVPVG